MDNFYDPQNYDPYLRHSTSTSSSSSSHRNSNNSLLNSQPHRHHHRGNNNNSSSRSSGSGSDDDEDTVNDRVSSESHNLRSRNSNHSHSSRSGGSSSGSRNSFYYNNYNHNTTASPTIATTTTTTTSNPPPVATATAVNTFIPRRRIPKKAKSGLKLQMPTKKQSDYDITRSGTFQLNDVAVGHEGLRSANTPYMSSSSNETPSSGSASVFHATSVFPSREYASSAPASISASTTPALVSPRNPTNGQSIRFDDLRHASHSPLLGRGATASVVKVKGPGNKIYALKVVPLHQADVKPKVIAQEIKSLISITNSSNIVRIYGAYHRQGAIQILLEYMDRGSLEDVYKFAGRIPENVLADIAYQILLGLEDLQANNIIHRDLKPSNILINKRGEAKISDFGLSKLASSSVQQFKTFQGTFMYMSPERLRGKDYGFDSDIYSFGLTIAECALGRFPYSDKPTTNMEIWDVIKHVEGMPLQFKPEDNISLELKEFLLACCQVNSKKRPTATQLKSFRFITKYIDMSKDMHDPRNLRRFLREVVRPKMAQRRKELKQREKAQASGTVIPSAIRGTEYDTPILHMEEDLDFVDKSPKSGQAQLRKMENAYGDGPDRSPRDRSQSSPVAHYLPAPENFPNVVSPRGRSPPMKSVHYRASSTRMTEMPTRERSSSVASKGKRASYSGHTRTNSIGDDGFRSGKLLTSSELISDLQALSLSNSPSSSSTPNAAAGDYHDSKRSSRPGSSKNRRRSHKGPL